MAIAAAGFLIAVVVVGATGVFLCIALYAFLSRLLSPALAGLACAGVVFLATMVVLALFGMIAGAVGRREEDEAPASSFLETEMARTFGANAVELIARNPKYALTTAIALGFLVGFSPRVRSLLLKLLQG